MTRAYAHHRLVEVDVNGDRYSSEIDVSLTLAEFLRNVLGLTGTRVSCELQVCGACSVLVDDRPVSACSFLAVDSNGTEVLTIEGVSHGKELDPVQQAFLDNFALQCGFCTPGFVVMAVALLQLNDAPSREEILDYLDGNICRCTGYLSIVDAVEAAAKTIRKVAT